MEVPSQYSLLKSLKLAVENSSVALVFLVMKCSRMFSAVCELGVT